MRLFFFSTGIGSRTMFVHPPLLLLMSSIFTSFVVGISPVTTWTPLLGFNETSIQHVMISAVTRWYLVDTLKPLSLCINKTYTADEIYQDIFYWPYSGIQKIQKIMENSYGEEVDGNSAIARERRYRAKTSKYGNKSTDDMTGNLTTLIQCAADAVDDIPHGNSYTAICSCLQRVDPNKMCYWLDSFASTTMCLDDMKSVLSIDPSTCTNLIRDDHGVPLSTKCSGWVAGSVTALDLTLNPLSINVGTPTDIAAGIAQKEIRTFYLLRKALQRFINMSTAVDLCLDSSDARLEAAENINILPTWSLKKMFWISNPAVGSVNAVGAGRTPLAGIFTREGAENCSECAIDDSILILVRDARSSYEAQIQGTFEAGRQIDQKAGGVIVHAGYGMLAQGITVGVETFVQKWLNKRQRLQPKITYSGYGLLGSGVASIVAHDISAQFKSTSDGMEITHQLVAFEPGRIGNFQFNSNLAGRVNVRAISHSTSGLGEFPCETPRACNESFKFVTGDYTGTQITQFLPLPGKVEPDTRNLKSEIGKFNLVGSGTCLTDCWLTASQCNDDKKDKCSYETGCLPMESLPDGEAN